MIEIVKSEFAALATLKEGDEGWGVIQENSALADETFVPNGFIRSAGFESS